MHIYTHYTVCNDTVVFKGRGGSFVHDLSRSVIV